MEDKKEEKKPKLTRKQAQFVKGIAEGKSATQAALAAYDTDDYSTAGAIATENLKKPQIREAVNDVMVKVGLDAESLLKPIKDALEANKEQYTEAGIVTSVDHQTRLKASELGLKLAGALGQKGEGTSVNINFNQHVSEKREEYGI